MATRSQVHLGNDLITICCEFPVSQIAICRQFKVIESSTILDMLPVGNLLASNLLVGNVTGE
jgi:hypothetical protein